jgi:hypothetical protein
VQQCQPDILVVYGLLTEIKCKDITQTVTREGARFHFTALDALDRSCADLTVFCQSFLGEAFLLPEFSNL